MLAGRGLKRLECTWGTAPRTLVAVRSDDVERLDRRKCGLLLVDAAESQPLGPVSMPLRRRFDCYNKSNYSYTALFTTPAWLCA